MVIPKGRHRRIAQKHWGLTDEQMKGMHVHHRIPVSEGGTNDPANLYVCSPKYHSEVWHDGDYFTLWANRGGNSNTESQRLGRVKGGKSPANQRTKDAVRKTGLTNKGKKITNPHNNQAKVTNTQKWRCLVTGKITTSGPLTHWQKHRGIDTSLRERIS